MSSATRAPVRLLTVPSLDSPQKLSSSSRVEQITQIGRISRQVLSSVSNVRSLTVPGEDPYSDHKAIHGFPSRSYSR